MHKLGWAGNFALPSHLQNIADQYALEIHQLEKAGGYCLHARNADFDCMQFCPTFITHKDGVFDLQNLRGFLEFLHHPILTTLTQAIPETINTNEGSWQKRYKQRRVREQDIHDSRTSIHRILRFAVSGSVAIPQNNHDNVEKYAEDKHAQTEQAMRDQDTWLSHMELGNSGEAISAIPNTSHNPARGFSFALDRKTFELGAHQGSAQRKMSAQFWDVLNKVSKNRYKVKTAEIYLSGQEFEALCRDLHENLDPALIEKVEFEEEVQEHLIRIEKKIPEIVISCTIADSKRKNTHAQLMALMEATTALTPILNSQMMRDVFTRYHYSKRNKHPLENIEKEYGVFLAVLDKYTQQSEFSPVQIEAIALEFYPLLAFSAKILETLDKELAKEANQDIITPLREKFSRAKKAFQRASVSGVFLNRQFMHEEHQDVLDALEKKLSVDGSILLQVGSAMGETAVDFTMDMVNFIRSDPKIAASFIALAATLIIMKGGDPNAAIQSVADYETALDWSTGIDTEITVDASDIPKDLFPDENFHWDLKVTLTGYELYKHFANSNFIVGPTQEFMEAIRSSIHGLYAQLGIPQNYDSTFDSAANAVIEPLASKLFAVNMFQNVSHAGFWMYATSKGFRHGLKGFEQLFDMAAPLTDLGYLGMANLSDGMKTLLGKQQKTPLSETLLQIAKSQHTQHKQRIRYEGDFKPQAVETNTIANLLSEPLQDENSRQRQTHILLTGLANVAQARSVLEKQLPPNICPTDIDLTINPVRGEFKKQKWKIGGLKKSFQISAENLQPTLDALNQLDHLMQHMVAGITSDEPIYLQDISRRVTCVQSALHDYAQTHDINSLQKTLDENLEHVLSAETRYRGEISKIYEALFEELPDQKTLKHLKRSASNTLGKALRAHKRQELCQSMCGIDKKSLTFTDHAKVRAKIAGSYMWAGMVGAARLCQRETEKITNKPTLIIGSAVAAACVGLDMAGLGNEWSSTVSGVTGGGIATSTTLVTFANFNFWEDIVAIHIGTGAALLASGAVAGWGYKKAGRPLIKRGLETQTGGYVRNAWRRTNKTTSTVAKYISSTIKEKNMKWGEILTKHNKKKYDNQMENSPFL